MESPKSRWYRRGQIVEVLDAEFGNIENVRQDLTVKDYFESILKTAPGNLGAYIISKLNTVEKVALFYSRFGLNLSTVSDNNIRTVLDELSKAKQIHILQLMIQLQLARKVLEVKRDLFILVSEK